MKAVVYDDYGSPGEVLSLEDVDTPVVEHDEVLVSVHAASVNAWDWHYMRGDPYILRLGFGLRKPRRAMVVGSDIAGRVEAVGEKVARFQPGDEVFADVEFGGCAEYIAVPAELVGLKPANLTFEQAAAVPLAALTALQGLRDHGEVQPGRKVLINGASGAVGTFAVQIAKALEVEVSGVCSTRNVDVVRSLGADHVIDYTQEDFTQRGQRYDLILDIAVKHSLSDCRRALAPTGTYVLLGNSGGHWVGGLSRFLRTRVLSRFVSQKLLAFTATPNKEDLEVLRELVEAGKVTPLIDRTYPLSETADAIGYLEEGHARGKVVITMEDNNKGQQNGNT